MLRAGYLLAGAVWLLGCHKSDPSPESTLPPATQRGANTFGCLLNGQAFTPNGTDGNIGGGPFNVVYDPAYRNGTLSVVAFRYTKEGDSRTKQGITVYADSVRGPGRYELNKPFVRDVIFYDRNTGCEFYSRDPHFRKGTLILTRVDERAGIIAGTFSLTLYKPGCDSVIVTAGRFDKKL